VAFSAIRNYIGNNVFLRATLMAKKAWRLLDMLTFLYLADTLNLNLNCGQSYYLIKS